jgi:N-acetylglucosamine malate deacetylase 1
MKLDILAVGVHPDDVELSCSGTLLKHIQLGYKVGLLDLTKGELGTRGSAEIRTEEATEAAQIMGALVREQLDLEDGFFTQNEAHLRKIIKIIRKYCPEIVFANAIDDRHPDHGRAAKLVSDACFLSGLVKIETLDENNIPQAPWRPKSLYHYIQDRALKPDFVVDITGYVDKKFELIMAYKSQFFDPLSIEPKTPISGKEFLDSIKGKDSVYGRYIGVQFAEGFNVEKTIGVQNVFDLM